MVIVVVVEAEKPWLWWFDVLVAEFTPNVLGHLWGVYGVRLANWLDGRPVQSADTMCMSCMFGWLVGWQTYAVRRCDICKL